MLRPSVCLILLALAMPAGAQLLTAVNPVYTTVGEYAPTATVSANGTTITIGWPVAMTRGAGWSGSQINIDGTSAGDNITWAYTSGDGTATWVGSISGATIYTSSTPNIDFDGGTYAVEDGGGIVAVEFTNGAMVNNSTQVASSCPSTPSEQNTTTNGQNNFGLNVNNYYSGQRAWSNAAAKTICRLDFQLSLANGSLTGKTFTARIWTLTGTSLNVNVATSTGVVGSNGWSATWVQFDFPTPYLTTGGVSYGLTIDSGTPDAANNAALLKNTTDTGLSGSNENWNDAGVFQSGAAEESCLRIYYY